MVQDMEDGDDLPPELLEHWQALAQDDGTGAHLTHARGQLHGSPVCTSVRDLMFHLLFRKGEAALHFNTPSHAR